jgi:hypothetical protein
MFNINSLTLIFLFAGSSYNLMAMENYICDIDAKKEVDCKNVVDIKIVNKKKNKCCHFCRASLSSIRNEEQRHSYRSCFCGMTSCGLSRCIEKWSSEDLLENGTYQSCPSCRGDCCCSYKVCPQHKNIKNCCFTKKRTERRHSRNKPLWVKPKNEDNAKAFYEATHFSNLEKVDPSREESHFPDSKKDSHCSKRKRTALDREPEPKRQKVSDDIFFPHDEKFNISNLSYPRRLIPKRNPEDLKKIRRNLNDIIEHAAKKRAALVEAALEEIKREIEENGDF